MKRTLYNILSAKTHKTNKKKTMKEGIILIIENNLFVSQKLLITSKIVNCNVK